MAKLDDSPASPVSAFDLENLAGEQLARPLSDHNAIIIMLTNGEGPQFVRNTILAAKLGKNHASGQFLDLIVDHQYI